MPQTIEGVPAATRELLRKQLAEQPLASLDDVVPVDIDKFIEAQKDLAPETKVEPIRDQVDAPKSSLVQEEIDSIKDQVNAALSTLIDMVVGLEERFDALDARIVEFNRKGGHKL